jgi:Lar family restriction alleviation protein
MSEELKRCPFCGYTKPKVREKNQNKGWYGDGTRGHIFYASVRCGHCSARGPVASTDKPIHGSDRAGIESERAKVTAEAAELWNRRT